jgi:hypothetical protein
VEYRKMQHGGKIKYMKEEGWRPGGNIKSERNGGRRKYM